jgi:hypothetical protein
MSPTPLRQCCQNGTAWTVAADFWLLVAMKALLGPAVLDVSGDDGSPVAAYAHCLLAGAQRREGAAGSGGGSGSDNNGGRGDDWRRDLSQSAPPCSGLSPPGRRTGPRARQRLRRGHAPEPVAGARECYRPRRGGAGLRTAPRMDWVFTAPGGPEDIGATAPVPNAFHAGGTLLTVAQDGSLPPMAGYYVPAGAPEALTLPPRSQVFSVLLEAGASACMYICSPSLHVPPGPGDQSTLCMNE